jgi:transposase-like protein
LANDRAIHSFVVMNIGLVYKKFPTQPDCIKHLEKARWSNIPICPYCNSAYQTNVPKENRHQCNNCNMSYSVMVKTIFHKTKIDLQKWFIAIYLTINGSNETGARKLARDINVTKDTSLRMLIQIRKVLIEDRKLLEKIIDFDGLCFTKKDRVQNAS